MALSKRYREAEFLPPVLEIMETPPSPTLRWTYWLIILFLVLASVWAYVGTIDIVVVARGKTIPDGQLKAVQAADAGRVAEILVESGDLVSAGDRLLILDPEGQTDTLGGLQRELSQARADELMNTALLGVDPLEVFDRAAISESGLRLATERLLTERYASHQSELRQLEEAEQSLLSEQSAIRIQIKQLDQTMPLLKQQMLSSGTLGEDGATGQSAILQMRAEFVAKQAEQDAARETLIQLERQVAQLQAQRDALVGRFRAEAAEAQRFAASQAAQLEFDIREQERLAARKVLSAPVSGFVHELEINTIGAVVTAGQRLMSIIPSDLPLVAEIAIENKDIGFASEGDPVELKFDAFPFTRYGLIDGVLTSIGRSTEEIDGQGAVYKATVILAQQKMRTAEADVPLTPGMSLSADIKTGQRRIAEYFLSPLLRYRDEVLRER